MKTKRNSIDKQKVINEFLKLKNGVSVAKIMNCSSSYIYRILKDNNISVNPSITRRFRIVNHNFFDTIDTEEKAYWLGFLYADGNVTWKSEISGHVSLTLKDEDHIQKFKDALNTDYPICKYVKKVGVGAGNSYYSIRITSQKMASDLEKLGCTRRKTYSLTFPEKSIFKSNDLIRHFIRGYFDGDGSVFYSNEKHWRHGTITKVIHYRFCGLKNFLEAVDREIGLNGIITPEKKSTVIYELHYKRKKKLIPFYLYLYKDATVYLQRKKEKFDQYIQEECSETIISQLNIELKG